MFCFNKHRIIYSTVNWFSQSGPRKELSFFSTFGFPILESKAAVFSVTVPMFSLHLEHKWRSQLCGWLMGALDPSQWRRHYLAGGWNFQLTALFCPQHCYKPAPDIARHFSEKRLKKKRSFARLLVLSKRQLRESVGGGNRRRGRPGFVTCYWWYLCADKRLPNWLFHCVPSWEERRAGRGGGGCLTSSTLMKAEQRHSGMVSSTACSPVKTRATASWCAVE